MAANIRSHFALSNIYIARKTVATYDIKILETTVNSGKYEAIPRIRATIPLAYVPR